MPGASNAATLTALDNVDGGAGTDTLNVTSIGAYTVPTTATVKNVEIANLVADNTITANVSGWTGLTTLKTTSIGASTLTAAATTDINATAASLTTGAVSINGGKDVAATASGATTGTVTVGGTTAAAGSVNVTYNGSFDNSADATLGTSGSVFVTGGTSVNVVQTSGAAAATKAANNYTVTQGKVTVTGTAATTTVSVTQDAAVTVAAGAGATGAIGVAAGAVEVLDVNRTSNTLAGSITTVSLNNFGAATVNSGALTTLNLAGKGTSVDASTLGALTTPANTALALNVNGLTTTGTVNIDTDIKTLNLASSTNASTINLLTNGATALNISGDAKVTLTGQTATANQVITVTNTAGAVLGTELDNSAKFTGGAGADSILLGATTKAHDMGDGDDVVTVSVTVLGAGGSVNGGAGKDTLVANTSGSSFSADPAFGGFEVLRVAGLAAQGSHNANGFSELEIGAVAAATTFTNVAAGVGLTVLAAPGFATTVTLANATGTADVFNLTLKSAATMAAGSITIAGVETVNITNTDTLTTTASGINTNTLTLVAAAAKSVVVTGNAGLTLTNTGSAAITSFDASGVTGAAADAAALAVTYTSANATVGESVTIKGGSGNDVLTGSATANDTIYGGDGADTLVYNGGADVFYGGAGADNFNLTATGTKTAYLTIADAAAGDKISFAPLGIFGQTGAIGAKVTLGASATFDQYLDAAATSTGDDLLKWFQFDGNTFVVADVSDNATFTAGSDVIVKLVGTINLANSTIASEVLTIV